MNCSFCDKVIGIGRGIISVKSDGTVSYYCSSKCEKNSKIRKAKNVRWTEVYRDRKAGNISKK